MNIEISVANYKNPRDAEEVGYLLDCYARDPMGGGKPLGDGVVEDLANQLAKLPHAFSILCRVDGKPAGLVNCFETFSTFQCKPLINIHDVVVVAEFRGHGISRLMMNDVERIAREKGCCKITLEVLEGNQIAKNAYKKLGYSGYELDPTMGNALFWQKPLNAADQ